jgi:intracellular multiplication protein IcmP
MAAAQQQQSGGPDNSLAFVWIMIGIALAVIVLWYTSHSLIAAILFKIRLAEISVVSLFTHTLDATRTQILSTAPHTATMHFLGEISSNVGAILAFPLAVILSICCFLLYRASAQNRYRKLYSMQKLKQQERKNWPQITPVVDLKLIDVHVHEGPWAMAMTPMQFAKKYKLLEEESVPDPTGISSREKLIAKIVLSRATQIFVRQLGRPWRGVDKLPVHAKALFAIFAAKTAGEREVANQLLRQIANSASTSGKLDFSGIDSVLKKYQDNKIIKKITAEHAYELTVMASLLEAARGDGVLASAEFLWLKPVDRPLWYMLSNVGRRVAFTEVAGPYAHWLAERLCGRKLIVPMVSEATTALVAAVEEVIYNPEQDF